jgi:elongation factor G
MQLPELIVFVVIDPKTQADQEKLGQGLQEMMAEDPTLRVNTDTRTGHTIIRGTGELHLEVIVDRLTREFNVAATIGKPQVAYRETIRAKAEHDYTHKKQTGGSGQYARTKLTVEPNPGKAFEFDNVIKGGSVPKGFIPAVEQGVRESLEGGILAGYPMVDIKVELIDGAYHEVDSSEIAFKICSSICFKEACRKAEPVLLEPVMRVEVVVPEEYMGTVNGDLSSRRGRLEGAEVRGATRLIKAMVPLSEMFGYAAELRSRTEGRASYTMHFARYEPLSGGPDTDNEDSGAPVLAPRTPTPTGNQSHVALPKPDDRG